jgi:ABC-type multidrug transport system fused ATPase/permease subunit
MPPPPESDGRNETRNQRLDRNWGELLQELRITQTGLQLLSGFLLTLPFTQVFAGLDGRQKALYLGLVVVAGLAVGLNLMPVMLHRRVFGKQVKERVVGVGHVVAQIVIAAIAVLVVGMVTLIFSVVVSWGAGIGVAVFLVVVLGALLGVVPKRLDRR